MKNLLAAFSLCILFAVPQAKAISIIFDYTYDTGNFFTPERRDVVNLAAQSFSNLAIDREGLTPTGPNTWTWFLPNPSNFNDQLSIVNPTIGAGEIRVFLGAQNLGGSTLGIGGNVGWSAGGFSSWINSVSNTNTAAHYKPFGGGLSLNNTISWYSGTDPNVTPGQFDLYSTISHELGHVLGIGLYGFVDAWDANVNTLNDTFSGSAATIAYGSAIPLSPDYYHIATGTQFMGQTMIMASSIPAGVRREWSTPELEMLVDMGYVAIPEPTASAAILLTLVTAAFLRRRRNR